MSHIHELSKTSGGHSQLINVLSNYVQLTEEESLVIIRNFNECNAPKRTILIDENSFCDKIFFVNRGILRSYYYAQNGKEVTSVFAGKNQFMTSLLSFRKLMENSEII
ncbi:hypothetical protein IMZ16_10285 [Cruoricaptor ignavus]|uniref:Cyclic nucleotide-binding domain-containing protein n=1 Tax=Cruoricaptor ignavus TaxID=1118202 RepID=A0A7M1T286_9FLAO|nr:hypothetical protein [Cruoricaptor ignavus]QOR73871.1 hypothetical protein IMZ16_10285 [Cruoricaptor ignavus]